MRFIARRWKPSVISADNRKQIVGAAKSIPEEIAAWNQSDIEQSLAQTQMKWKFNPFWLF